MARPFLAVSVPIMLGFAEIELHLVDLPGIAPVRAGFDRHQIFAALTLELKIDSFSTGFFAAEGLRANKYRGLLQKLAKQRLLLRRQMRVEQITHQIAGGDVVFGAEKIRVLPLEDIAQLEPGKPFKPFLVKLRDVFFDELF